MTDNPVTSTGFRFIQRLVRGTHQATQRTLAGFSVTAADTDTHRDWNLRATVIRWRPVNQFTNFVGQYDARVRIFRYVQNQKLFSANTKQMIIGTRIML